MFKVNNNTLTRYKKRLSVLTLCILYGSPTARRLNRMQSIATYSNKNKSHKILTSHIAFEKRQLTCHIRTSDIF